MMSSVRGKNTKPEKLLRLTLHRMGFRYHLHVKDLPGKPDLVLPRHRAVILVHGCFWHRHGGCKYCTTPSTNADFWLPKFDATVERDSHVLKQLRQLGWRIGVVWECALRRGQEAEVAGKMSGWLLGDAPNIELPKPAETT